MHTMIPPEQFVFSHENDAVAVGVWLMGGFQPACPAYQ